MKRAIRIGFYLTLIFLCVASFSPANHLFEGNSPENTPPLVQERKDYWEAFTNLPADGLTHEPFGRDSLYGNKEAPVLWWTREPHNPVAGSSTSVNISVGASADNKDIWIEWTCNGQSMDPVSCKRRAKLTSDGISKTHWLGELPPLSGGDAVQYVICAGTAGCAEKSIGPFAFTTAAWEPFHPMIMESAGNKLRVLGVSGATRAVLTAEVDDDGRVCMAFHDGDDNGYEASSSIEGQEAAMAFNGQVSFTIDREGFFVLKCNQQILLQGSGLSLLTDGKRVYKAEIRLSAEEEDGFYGFGMKYDALNQRGKVVNTYCVNWYKDQRGETYTPVPYYFVPNKYGLFIDSTYFSQFKMCVGEDASACVMQIDLGNREDFRLPFYFFTGQNRQLAASYAKTAGKAELPPVWAFSPWISANEWNRQSEIMEQLNKTVELEIPTGVVVIEAWSDEETFYTFNDSSFETTSGEERLMLDDFSFSGRWNNPMEMIEALHGNDIRCILWQIPVLKYSTSATAQSVRDQNYAQEKGFVLQYENGDIYRLPKGTWFGNSLLIDFTNEEAVSWFMDKRRYLTEELGIDGFKTDGGEFVWGRSIEAFNGMMGDELRNAYPDLYSQAYYDFGKSLREDFVTFSRSGGSSMQKHPLCWIGDQNSDFAAFQSAIRAILSASMSGIPFVTWDLAGFSGDVPSTELYFRSVAQAAFSPVMQLHSETAGDPVPSQARTPWNMAERKKDDACIDVYRYYANLHMNLLPYIYTEAKWAAESGEPMMRSMAYEFPEDKVAEKYELQYMLGRQILVAPVAVPNVKKQNVYLPDGVWYDFFTGKRYEGGVHEVCAEPEQIPVFVREGTILPVNVNAEMDMPSYVGNGTENYKKISYVMYPGEGKYQWYDYVNERYVNVINSNGCVVADGEKTEDIIERIGEP